MLASSIEMKNTAITKDSSGTENQISAVKIESISTCIEFLVDNELISLRNIQGDGRCKLILNFFIILTLFKFLTYNFTILALSFSLSLTFDYFSCHILVNITDSLVLYPLTFCTVHLFNCLPIIN